ncbi:MULTISPECIES: hypothetical protein [Parabacteroides]|uniref:hypothetical protein n=1 Tax=Parabacteroides TaxID=375288 RepID=UPI00202DCFD6|nr:MULTISPECIES: hypothetical protein [Parabacteroides]MCM0712067.1 hypothetical protein [Parabacteroides sp. TA-V-105]
MVIAFQVVVLRRGLADVERVDYVPDLVGAVFHPAFRLYLQVGGPRPVYGAFQQVLRDIYIGEFDPVETFGNGIAIIADGICAVIIEQAGLIHCNPVRPFVVGIGRVAGDGGVSRHPAYPDAQFGYREVLPPGYVLDGRKTETCRHAVD